MINENNEIVAVEAAEVYRKIKQLRQELPQTNRAEKDEFERQVNALKDDWFKKVKPLMIKR